MVPLPRERREAVSEVVSGDPFPKDKQLARGERRYRRKVASPKQWQAIAAAKLGPCRVCVRPLANGGTPSYAPHHVEFHHLVPRVHGGDDLEDNIVPLCHGCHSLVTRRSWPALAQLAASLDESERGYVLRKLGADGYSRLFGAPADA